MTSDISKAQRQRIAYLGKLEAEYDARDYSAYPDDDRAAIRDADLKYIAAVRLAVEHNRPVAYGIYWISQREKDAADDVVIRERGIFGQITRY